MQRCDTSSAIRRELNLRRRHGRAACWRPPPWTPPQRARCTPKGAGLVACNTQRTTLAADVPPDWWAHTAFRNASPRWPAAAPLSLLLGLGTRPPQAPDNS